jgi:hypothetical protein
VIRLLMSCAVALALVWSSHVPADAGWKCEKRHCFWDPNYTGPTPDFAANWGPPDQPTCYYVQRRISKRWAKVCPEVPLQAR